MKDAAHCQRIEIQPVTDGWVVTEGDHTAGRFDSVETAYKKALAICGDLFERGVRSQVCELSATA
jgi:hypothetical protein